ncbi:MAG: serine protease [Rhodobacterales bacterium]|nr:MAG: serine protease [Rhodobacterales bacterium]
MALALAGACPAMATAETRVPASAAEVTLSFAPVVAAAAPSVVNIYATRMVAERSSSLFDDPFFRQFFGDTAPSRTRKRTELGSGVIVGGGLVVSNYHVIENATGIRVVLTDRREYEGTLVLADEAADLAVIRLDEADAADLPALPFADSDALAVGDLVLAIGNPFGVGQTVSSGIVSGLARTGRGGGAYNGSGYFVQTDAPINPGNSGGALVDMRGRLVGINTQIVTRSGGSNGIGFAVPANLVARVVEQAEAGAASFTRPWAGIGVQPVDAGIAEALGLDRPTGVLVQDLAADSPFAAAGVQPGDLVLTVAGHAVNAPEELGFRLSLQEMGTEVPVSLLRKGRELEVSVTMRAAVEADEALDGGAAFRVSGSGPFDGLVLQEIGPSLRDRLGLSPEAAGVIVVGLENPRSGRNFQPGDIIAEINGVPITGMEDFKAVAEAAEADGRRNWSVVMNRRGGLVYLTWRG